MTTTAPRADEKGAGITPAPPPVEYPHPLTRGAYVALIAGPHGRYGLDRIFDIEYRTRNKKAGRIVYLLRPGWYEVQDKPGRRRVVAVDSRGLPHDLDHPGTDRDALRPLGKAARRGETIDTPGAYRGRFCWCGADATHHQPRDGRARCQAHYKPPAQDGPPDPAPPADYDPDEIPAPIEIPAEWLREDHR